MRIGNVLRKSATAFAVTTAVCAAVFAGDPHTEYAAILGGSGADFGHGIAVDSEGCAYVAGQANSIDFPTTPGAFDCTHNGGPDFFITKLDRAGKSLEFSTFIGGASRDSGGSIFVDAHGNVFAAGASDSSDFPVTANAIEKSGKGYFLKLSSSGSTLEQSSRYPGGDDVTLDSGGNLILVGSTGQSAFMTTGGAYDRSFGGGQDVFITKIDPRTGTVLFSTLLGGRANDTAVGVHTDSADNIIVTGITASPDFPVSGNTFSRTGTDRNAFAIKLSFDGSRLLYSAVIGGSGDEWVFGSTADRYGNVFVTGTVKTADFPITAHAYDTTHNGGDDAFLFKLSEDGSTLLYSTYLGGSLKESGRGVVTDSLGRAYVTGCTQSENFPVSPNAVDSSFNGSGSGAWAWGDAFLLVLNAEGTGIEYSTYLGGRSDEEAYAITMDPAGCVYLSGVTSSRDFPATEGAYDVSVNGTTNTYIVKYSFP